MRKLATLLVVASCFLLAQQPPPPPLSVNPGYWEVASVAHLPQGTTPPNISHRCVLASQLSQPTLLVDSPYCTTTLVKSTTTSADMTIVCTSDQGKSQGTLHLDVNSSTSVTGKAQMQFSMNGNTLPITADYTAKWLSAKCSAN